mgnify:FL=1
MKILKRILVAFSVTLVVIGFFVSQNKGFAEENPQKITDTVNIPEADTVRPLPNVSAKAEADTAAVSPEDTVSRSNILLDKSNKNGFSIFTILRGLLGMFVLVIIAWLFSKDRKAVDWLVVGKGLFIQLVLALSILYIPVVADFFDFVGKIFVKILDFTQAGSEFLFGPLVNQDKIGYIFVFQILPTIVFFSALTSVLFYFGVIQLVVKGLAWVMVKALKISGAESLSVAGNIFIGQTESPLMIKKYYLI